MIGYLTKDKEGYKLHDSFGAFFNENTKTWESCNSNMILREDSIEDSLKNLCENKDLKVLIHITPIASKYESKRITEVRQGDKVAYREFNFISWLFDTMNYGDNYGKHIATIEGIDWYNCKYLVKKHKDKKPKWYDWSEFELI